MDIVVPELGESVVEATVARWLKKEGEPVRAGEAVVELETDKVDLEVSATQSGVLTQILHPEGADVQVGQVLGRIEPSGEPAPEQPSPAGAEAPAQAPSRETAPAAAPSGPAQGNAGQGAAKVERPRVTPVARRMAEQQGINLEQISTARPGERVTRQDVERFLQQGQPAPQPQVVEQARPAAGERPAPALPAAPPGTDGQAVTGRREIRERMSRRRRTIAARLVEAQQTAAMLTTFNDVDMTAVMEIRRRRKDSFQEKYGVKLGLMSFFVKAVIGALKAFPRLNAEIQGDEIVLKQYYDIGIAVGAEEGLVVPVLHDADRMSFAEIEKAILNYIDKVRNGTLSLEDLRGGTFTITNGGVFGSLLSTPILNPPQVGILGLHRIEDRPVVINKEIVIRPMMYMALSYDHRIVDGREAVQFLVKVKELIEDPETLLLEG
jgi:2-oxoglutarate dehydrogenase E2 component (dihydrolipoamide succinyltransferase)